MKIIFFTDHFYPEISAPAAHIFDRCRIWVKKGHDVTVITNFPNYPDGKVYSGYSNKIRKWEKIEGIDVLRVKTFITKNSGTYKRTLDYISFTFSSFLNSIFLKNPDIVMSSSPHIFVPIGALFFCFLRRVPHVLEVRDLWPESISATTNIKKASLIFKIFEILEIFIYKSSKEIIVFTKSFKKNLIQKKISEKKINVVINGANLELFKRVKDPIIDENIDVKNKFVIGYFGTHGLSHGLNNVIEAAKILKNSNIVFLFIGDGAKKNELVKNSQKNNLKNIIFLEKKKRESLPNYWSLCSAGLIHLKDDDFFKTVIPSKIFETMANGLPIIYAGPDGDGADLIRELDVGLISGSKKPIQLVNNILTLENDKDTYNKLKKNSIKSSKIFSRDAQAENTFRVFEKIINK